MVASVMRNIVSTTLVFGVALAIGFRPAAGPLDWLGVFALLLLFMVAISWLAAAFGLLARDPEAAGAFTVIVMFLPYVSSAFVPTDTMPGVLHAIADAQPVTPIVGDAARPDDGHAGRERRAARRPVVRGPGDGRLHGRRAAVPVTLTGAASVRLPPHDS